MKFEEDSIQNHIHLDSGHSHTDTGHTHSYEDWWYGGHCGDQHHKYVWDYQGCMGDRRRTSYQSQAQITTEKSGISEVDGDSARVATETKPKSYSVLYIMRVA